MHSDDDDDDDDNDNIGDDGEALLGVQNYHDHDEDSYYGEGLPGVHNDHDHEDGDDEQNGKNWYYMTRSDVS